MPIGMKPPIPGYKARWTGRQVDDMIQKIMESYDSAFLVIPSTEAIPYNIDCLLDIGHYSIEYVTKSVLPSTIVDLDIRPYDITNVMIGGTLHQAIRTLTDTYVRTYDPDTPVNPGCGCPPDCDCGCNPPLGTWSKWEHYSVDVPDDVVVYEDTPGFEDLPAPTQPIDAEWILIHKTDGTSISLQDYYEAGLLPGGSEETPGNENDNPVAQTTPVQWRADKVTIVHRGVPYSLSDIMDKILSL